MPPTRWPIRPPCACCGSWRPMGQSHVAWGQAVLETLTQDPGRAKRRALEMQAEIEARLVDLRRRDGPGDRGALADLSQHARGGQAAAASGAAAGAPTAIARAARRWSTRWSRSRSGSPTSRPTSSVYQPRTSGRWRASATSSTNCSTARWKPPTAWARWWPSSPICPWEMRMELAHQMWDEARHIEIVAKACEEELGGDAGLWPLDAGLVVDAERDRPAAAPDRDQQLGRSAT